MSRGVKDYLARCRVAGALGHRAARRVPFEVEVVIPGEIVLRIVRLVAVALGAFTRRLMRVELTPED